MERSPAMAYLLVAALVVPPAVSITTSKAAPRPPQLLGCVFLYRSNVTCRWDPGDTQATTHFTLQVVVVSGVRRAEASTTISPANIFTCSTSDTSCTVITGLSARFPFCITVTAHGGSGDASSPRRCQSGRVEVMLPPANLDAATSVKGRPQCLNVTWSSTLAMFPVSYPEIKNGKLNSQMELTALGQFDVQVKNVTVTDYSFLVCLFRPDTLYTLRLRHRFLGPSSPWSPWSNACQGKTGEDAPAVAPAFWRRMKRADESGLRLLSLLWKPLPRILARGKVLFFNVTCWTAGAQLLKNHGSCRDLYHTNTSCSLYVPADQCSCALTASNSAGASPEARIWILAASDAEPPPPSSVIARPLDDSSLDVRWTSPAHQSVSGFVVEWSAVWENNSAVLHWEKLNGSCTTLVITEGVKPLERYVVSVSALYGGRGVGQNKTIQLYTREGAPSAGPNIAVQQISGSRVKLVWSPVPVEKLHGFIRSYTINYTGANQPTKSVFIHGHIHSCSLENLLPDIYDIYIQANTDAGPGAPGFANVHIGSEEISMVMCVLLPLMLTSLALVLMVCLAQNKMVKQKLCQDIPDPSNSSVARWSQKTALEVPVSTRQLAVAEKAEIKYSEVILLGESELQNTGPDKHLNYQSICNLQTYSCPHQSLLAVSQADTPKNTRKSDECIHSSTRAETNSGTDNPSSPSIYSHVIVSPRSPPTPLFSHSYLPFSEQRRSSLSGINLQLGGDSEPSACRSMTRSDSPPSRTDHLKTSPLFLRLSHPAEVVSSQRPFSESIYNPDTLTALDAFPTTFTTLLSPFALPVFVDVSYHPIECNPYISADI